MFRNPFFWIFMAVVVVCLVIMAWMVFSDSRWIRKNTK